MFNNCGASAEYEHEVFKMTKPGLSSYDGRLLDAAQRVAMALDLAMDAACLELCANTG